MEQILKMSFGTYPSTGFKHIITSNLESNFDTLREEHKKFLIEKQNLKPNLNMFEPIFFNASDIQERSEDVIYMLREGRRFNKLAIIRVSVEEWESFSENTKRAISMHVTVH